MYCLYLCCSVYCLYLCCSVYCLYLCCSVYCLYLCCSMYCLYLCCSVYCLYLCCSMYCLYLCCSMYCLYLCCSMYCLYLCCYVYSLCVNVYCTVPLPPGVNPIAVDKYIYINKTLNSIFQCSLVACTLLRVSFRFSCVPGTYYYIAGEGHIIGCLEVLPHLGYLTVPQ